MSKALLLFALPTIGWLIYKSEQWEEGEWIKKQTRKVLFSTFQGMKEARRYFTDPDLLPQSFKRNDDGVIVRIGKVKKK